MAAARVNASSRNGQYGDQTLGYDKYASAREGTMQGLSQIVEAGEGERLATGFVFTGRPLWHPDGVYYFVDVRASKFYRLRPGSPAELLRGNTGEGNGTTFDSQGRLVLCEG